MRTMRTRVPKSIDASARTAFARPLAFSAAVTESSRSMQTASAADPAAFSIIAGRDAGTKSMLRIARARGRDNGIESDIASAHQASGFELRALDSGLRARPEAESLKPEAL